MLTPYCILIKVRTDGITVKLAVKLTLTLSTPPRESSQQCCHSSSLVKALLPATKVPRNTPVMTEMKYPVFMVMTTSILVNTKD
jgi:hypothetical protein